MANEKISEQGSDWFLKNREEAEKRSDELAERQYAAWLEAQEKRRSGEKRS